MKKIFALILVFALGLLLIGYGEDPSLSFEKTSVTVEVGEEFELQPKVENLEGTDLVKYAFDTEGVVEAKGANKFTAVKVGNVKITASLKDYEDITCEINVTVNEASVKVSEITLSGNNSVSIGKSVTLSATILPEDAANKELDWTTSDAGIATVENGTVTGIKEGIVTIKATAKDGSGVYGELNVTVTPETVDPTSITLTGKGEMNVEEVQTLVVSFEPENGFSNVTWSSSNEEVVKVENGKVTALKAGNATITAKTANNLEATFDITVKGTEMSTDELSKKLSEVLDAYLSAQKASLKIEYANNDVVLVEDYAFELNGENSFTKLYEKLSGASDASIFIVDEMIYMNANGVLGKYPIDDSEIQDIFASHKVETVLKDATSFYKEKEFYNALVFVEETGEKVVFDLDILNYKGSAVNTLNKDSIQLIVSFANGGISKVEFVAVSGENVSKATVSFLGLDFILDFPSDLETYPDA